MPNHYGALCDLEQVIQKHLFIIAPNNSGSTYLQNVLSTSGRTWNLIKEGQHTFGYKGVSKTNLIWAATRPSIKRLTEASRYDWEATKRAWYLQSFSKSCDADVFVTKSPPFLLITDMLKEHFKRARFIFMVRNPYAVVEGICRREGKAFQAGEKKFQMAAQHIITCFKYQKRNIEVYGNALFFTYEQMCNDHVRIEKRIKKFIPELDDLKLKQKISVKGLYFEELRDMNQQQLDRLSADDIRETNKIFKDYEELLAYFGYALLNREGKVDLKSAEPPPPSFPGSA